MTTTGSRRALGALLLIFMASRLLVFGAGFFGVSRYASGREVQPGNVQRPWSAGPLLEPRARWDAEWYLLVAEEGYHLQHHMEGRRVRYAPADATGFFPLYPLLVRGLGEVLARLPWISGLETRSRSTGEPVRGPGGAPYLLAGALISDLSLLLSALLLYRRVLETGHAGAPATEGMALFSAAALLFHPSSFFLSAVYAESLLLLLTLACFTALRRRRWLAAALAGALASATKPAGILLAAPALVALAGASGSPGAAGGRPPARWTSWLSLALYPSGLALFSWYCGSVFGDPLSWARRQMRWRGEASGPWRAFARWAEDPQWLGAHHSTMEMGLALLAVVLLAFALRRRPVAESAFAALVILPPLGSTLWSFGRLSLQAFPLFIVLGCWMARGPARAAVWLLPSAAGLFFLASYYAAWWWAG